MKSITEMIQTLYVGDVCYYTSDDGKGIAIVEEIKDDEICFKDLLQLDFCEPPQWVLFKSNDTTQLKFLFSSEEPKTRSELALEKIKEDYPEMFL